MSLLAINNLTVHYGAVQALLDVSLVVEKGEIVTLLGANGAGKSTLLMAIFSVAKPLAGDIYFQGQRINDKPAHQVAALGIAQSPEGRRIFPKMTVKENLQMGAILANPQHFNQNIEQIYDLFPRLKERQEQRAGTMSGGEQQMLAIGRALMAEPTLLLLDEPSLGIAPILVQQIFAAIERINRETGLSILLVEQNAHKALQLAKRGYVLANGELVMQGAAADLLADPKIQAAYLGH
ncbi:MAG: ABC transporter ATP-binding protein [Alphaproteobacteria bacterium]